MGVALKGKELGRLGMAAFHLTGIENGTISKDRTGFEINLRTDQGPLELTISAKHLNVLVTHLDSTTP